MITLDEAREEFSRFLAQDPQARWRIDAALAHVVRWAYARGREDAIEEVHKQTSRSTDDK